MTLSVASRSNVPPFSVMEILAKANAIEATGKSITHLEIGQPSNPPPEPVLARAVEILKSSLLGYTESGGIPELRESLARYYRERYNVDVSAECIAITTGSSAAFQLAFLSAFNPGDRVAVPVPGYPAYRNILSALGIEVVIVPCGSDVEYRVEVEKLDEHSPLSGLIIASPANPTGTMLDGIRLKRISEYCADRDIRIVSDEIYHGITFGETAATVVGMNPDAIIINSFSKYFCMTGWRLGWVVLPEELVGPVERLAQNFYLAPPTISQHAALAAFDCAMELDGHVERYRHNRDLLIAGLAKLGLDQCAPTDGAFYLYVDVSSLTNNSPAFCDKMLKEASIAASPGTDFDPVNGASMIRLSYAGSENDMHTAVKRLGRWIQ